MRGASLIGLDNAYRGLVCSAQGPPQCVILDRENSGVTWQAVLPEGRNVVGGAIGNDRVYVLTEDGWLHALGAN